MLKQRLKHDVRADLMRLKMESILTSLDPVDAEIFLHVSRRINLRGFGSITIFEVDFEMNGPQDGLE